jgi:uncharacterized membrane protein YqjE
MAEEAGHTSGLLDSLRNLARTVLATVQTRVELLASDIDEQRVRLARIVVLAAVAALCLGLAVILLVFFLVVLFWETDRLLAIGVLCGVFATGGIAARSAFAQRPKFLSATLAELRKDETRLGGP